MNLRSIGKHGLVPCSPTLDEFSTPMPRLQATTIEVRTMVARFNSHAHAQASRPMRRIEPRLHMFRLEMTKES